MCEQDKTIASLKSLISDLNQQVAALSTKSKEATTKAQVAISNKNRPIALAALKSRKLTDATLTQRIETLSQLEEIYHKIEQAADQVALVKVMKGSTSVLRNLRAETGGVEKVEDVIEELREEIDKADEVSSAMEAGGQNPIVIDEGEIDEELEEMLKQSQTRDEESQAEHTRQQLARIPSIEGPTTAPLRSDAASKPGELDTVRKDHDMERQLDQSAEALEKLALNEGSSKESDQAPESSKRLERPSSG